MASWEAMWSLRFPRLAIPFKALAHADIELAELESVSGVLGKLRPDVIVNTAAMHHVDKCEAGSCKGICRKRHRRTESGASRE